MYGRDKAGRGRLVRLHRACGQGKELKHFIFNAMYRLVITLSLQLLFFSLSFFLLEPCGLGYLSSPTRV